MADQKITQLIALTNSNVDVLDVLPIVDVSGGVTDKITYQNLMRPKDSVFGIVDDGDITKIVTFQVSGLTTATTRVITVPDSDLTLVGLATTQTLTNKTLTSPQINMGSNATGDIYFRNASGVFTNLSIGATNTILSVSSGGIPEWIANPSAADASTTVKGVSEEATQAEVLARTAAGGTSARLFVNPTTLTTVQTYDYAADAVGTDAYAITVTPAPVAYVTGQVFRFKAGTANTGACSLNVNSLGAKTIKKNVSTDLDTGDIALNQIVEVIYDGTNFQIVSRAAVVVTYKNGVDNSRRMDDASGSLVIAHGLGSVPKRVRINVTNTTSAAPSTSFGSYNGTTTSCAWSTADAGTEGVSSSDMVHMQSALNTQTATIAVDATNITLTFTRAGGSAQADLLCMVWEAEG